MNCSKLIKTQNSTTVKTASKRGKLKKHLAKYFLVYFLIPFSFSRTLVCSFSPQSIIHLIYRKNNKFLNQVLNNLVRTEHFPIIKHAII